MALLEIRDLTVRYSTKGKSILACDRVSLLVEEQDSVGIVGESGSGKSTLAMAVLGLLPDAAQVEGEISFKGVNLAGLSDRAYAQIRWKELLRSFKSP